MKVVRETIRLVTREKLEFHDITKLVKERLAKHGVKEGVMLLNSLHTTVALFINEFQDALLYDLRNLLQRLVGEQDGYRHNDPRYSDCDRNNATSHLRAVVLGRNLALGVADGKPVLGRYQSIIFAELDGPQERQLELQVIGE